ncbi:carbohydrate sulfotransferase 1 [Lingula anatina]|uniref:Carbohydrate sulfotransferase 1 n=1 Tax=Lingula anatina TaxID=7574 RepID=A0A1S3KH87_LINAN|nr:carbohydrate sulfotransferase 1 [Lingula anatina]XP_013422002.1 carbohydrate sulfotransferase 1 [Lingula anatina]|eukprot:XP_013421993.1 carbohydrate sulfotransferase 1 [Lingula anatina]
MPVVLARGLRFLSLKVVFVYALLSCSLFYYWLETGLVTNDPQKVDRLFVPLVGIGEELSARQVIILTYQRSGSSFTGELFNKNDHAFYLFEPIWGFYKSMEKYGSLTYPNGTTKPAPKHGIEFDETTQIVDDLLNCRMFNIPLDVTAPYDIVFQIFRTDKGKEIVVPKDNHDFQAGLGRHQRLNDFKYFDCLKSKRGLGKASCLPLMQEACRTASLKTLKLLRIRMNQVETLMQKNPRLKVIHLVRDPRAALISRRKVGEMIGNLEMEANMRCMEILRDYSTRQRLEHVFPNRIMQVRYEDLAEFPTETATAIYEFLGLPFPKSVEKWLFNATQSAGNVTKGIGDYGTVRKNSTATAHAWIQKISPADAFQIDQVCSVIYPLLGYRPYKELQPLRNLTGESLSNNVRGSYGFLYKRPKPPVNIDWFRENPYQKQVQNQPFNPRPPPPGMGFRPPPPGPPQGAPVPRGDPRAAMEMFQRQKQWKALADFQAKYRNAPRNNKPQINFMKHKLKG